MIIHTFKSPSAAVVDSNAVILSLISFFCNCSHVQIQRGGGAGGPDPPPMKNHKNIWFLINCGPDPLKITKLPSQHSMLGHHQHASETPFRRFAGGPMMARL